MTTNLGPVELNQQYDSKVVQLISFFEVNIFQEKNNGVNKVTILATFKKSVT